MSAASMLARARDAIEEAVKEASALPLLRRQVPAATDTEERRVDPADGNAYTRQEFIDEYGGTAEWDQAAGSQ